MRKAKVAALIIGGVSTCIFGGLFGVYATAPVVSSVAPNNDVENIYEVESEELANVAAVTSIRTTAITTTSKITTTANLSFSTYTPAVSTTTTTAAVKDTLTMSASFNGASARPSYMANNTEAPTEAPTEAYTETPVYDYEYTDPATESWVEPETDAPVWNEPETDQWTEPEPEVPTEPVTSPSPDYWETITPAVPEELEDTTGSLSISDEDYIILCNAVAHEAGCNWIDTYDKAKVVEVIMNRVNSPLYPNTVLGVLTQPYQFSGSSNYVYLGDYSGHVTQSVKDAVTLYFNEPESFSHGYFGFYGDGYRNYFY